MPPIQRLAAARVGRDWPLWLTGLALAGYASSLLWRPADGRWAWLYDVVLYNGVYAGAAAVCLRTARTRIAETTAWRAVACALTVSAAGSVWYSLVVAPSPEQSYPSLADVLWLAYYPLLYIALLALIRARVRRFLPSMWLDGLIGVLGAAAVALSVLLEPALTMTDGSAAAVAFNLAYPLADVLLLVILGGVGAILGLRRDRTLWLLGVGLSLNLAADIVYLNLAATGIYAEGGLLDLAWLVGAALLAAAAHAARTRPATVVDVQGPGSRLGWQLLAIPLSCNVVSLLLLGAGWVVDYPGAAALCAIGCVLVGLLRTVLTFRDVRTLHEVRAQARTDELTGLPNRRALLERAHDVLSTATAGRPAALLLLDLDGFKDVNDSLGHHAGDELLRQLAARLTSTLQLTGLAARLGGDEFAVLLPDADLDEALLTAERLQHQLSAPFALEGIRVHVGASIGVATAPVPASAVTELLRCADVAMYLAKSTRAGVRAYLPDPNDGAADRLHTMEDLRQALESSELLIHLQPQFSLAQRRPVGVEALVRWQHPRRGLLYPGTFLPAAEQAGLLRPLTDAVLDLALAAAARWWSSVALPVSVNLSAANLTDVDLPRKVTAALERHGLPPAALTLELVEDMMMADPERGREVLGRLRGLGVRTSIDDYGTGYSSLAYLRHLPADELKLDRSLTRDLDSDPAAAAIVEHTVALAHALGLTLVAEGVEDLAAADSLSRLGCDVGQGYALARPMPLEQFLPWLQARTTTRAAR